MSQQMSHAQTVAFNAGAAEAGRRIAELKEMLREEHDARMEAQQELKMRCPQCSAIAPENEKDWPDTKCVVCVLQSEIERLKVERDEAWAHRCALCGGPFMYHPVRQEVKQREDGFFIHTACENAEGTKRA